MTSDNLRKKWGTIFMGDHEATVEQLEAMHEPLRREQEKKEKEADYLSRVRARATEKAREILGAAYAERQNVMDEARQEAEKIIRQAQKEGEALKMAAQAAYREAADEREKAKALREEAERIRDAARDEGLKAGMLESRSELRALRSEMGQSIANILKSIQTQRDALFATWRREIVELVQTAVAAATGWLLYREEEKILESLTMQALNLLENRNGVIIKVNPEDEQTIGDMFLAAQERYPELRHWTVKTDPEILRGGLIAESSSGSVDSTRERFRSMIVSILSHLALPENEQDDAHRSELARLVEKEIAQHDFASPELAPPVPDTPAGVEPVQEAILSPEQNMTTLEAEAEDPARMPAEISQPEMGDGALHNDDEQSAPPQASAADTQAAPDLPETGAPDGPPAETEPEDHDMPGSSAIEPEAYLPPLGEDDAAASRTLSSADPTYEELEDELFSDADDPNDMGILSSGGFLPGNDK